jgi:predicted HTH transcriptional regulator
MRCERCGDTIDKGEERKFRGQTLCEDCYMDALSPPSAKKLSKGTEANLAINETQAKILKILEETGGTELKIIAERLQIKPSDLEREIAALRHTEKVRGELKEGKKILRLW